MSHIGLARYFRRTFRTILSPARRAFTAEAVIPFTTGLRGYAASTVPAFAARRRSTALSGMPGPGSAAATSSSDATGHPLPAATTDPCLTE